MLINPNLVIPNPEVAGSSPASPASWSTVDSLCDQLPCDAIETGSEPMNFWLIGIGETRQPGFYEPFPGWQSGKPVGTRVFSIEDREAHEGTVAGRAAW